MLNYNAVYNKEKAGKAKEFKKVDNNTMINAEQQLDKSELQIKLEWIMLERSMERTSRKSELEPELTANNNMFDEVKFEDPSDNIELIFHNGVPIVVISKGHMMKPIAVQRQNFGMLAYNNRMKPRRPRRSSRRGCIFKEKAGKAKEFKKVGNKAMINADQQLDESELQIKVERIMLERSMERMSRKSELESELTANNNMFDKVKSKDPSDDIEVIFHYGVPIVVISKGDMMKRIAAQRHNFAMLNYNHRTKAKKAKKVQQEGLHLHEEGQQEELHLHKDFQQEGSEEEEKASNIKGEDPGGEEATGRDRFQHQQGEGGRG